MSNFEDVLKNLGFHLEMERVYDDDTKRNFDDPGLHIGWIARIWMETCQADYQEAIDELEQKVERMLESIIKANK